MGKETFDQLSATWESWINDWSQFPLNGFLRSKSSEIQSKLKDKLAADDLEALDKLVPWPEEALTAYSIFTYTEQLDQCLVQFLRDELGEWWSSKMHCIDGGMSKLPAKFEEVLREDITFNVTVNEIEYTATAEKVKVVVRGYFSNSGQPYKVKGDAVIVTTPLPIIRLMKIYNTRNTPEFPPILYQAMEDVWYGPSTKIMIQTKTRFWEDNGIHGGFSKTNLPVGQIHYPTKEDNPLTEKGILLVYTWKSEALQFGALHPQIAVREAVRQIASIHPTIERQFEVGAVQAWYNEPSAQGAYALLKPHQYRNITALMYPFLNVFFAGEALSFGSGWIQGALESGLRAAYQFYSRNEENKLHVLENTN